MRRALQLLACITFAAGLTAQQPLADLRVDSVTIDKGSLKSGERVTITTRVANGGPNAAEDVLVTFTHMLAPVALAVNAPAGWTCDAPYNDRTSHNCSATSLAPGAQAEIAITVLLQPLVAGDGPFAFTANASIGSMTGDPQPQNNHGFSSVPLTVGEQRADIRVEAPQPVDQVDEGSPVELTFTVDNRGPSPAATVFATIVVHSSAEQLPFTVEGGGWTCAALEPARSLCTRPSIAGGGAPLTVKFTAPNREAQVFASVRVFAEGVHEDDPIRNNFAEATVNVASDESWRRILVPLASSEIPGANGALWRTETTALVAADEVPEVYPNQCDFIIVLCPGLGIPVRKPFDANGRLVGFVNTPGGQFVFVRVTDEASLRLNSRVYDAARETETAGAEIPIVRDLEFTSNPMSLLGIPVAAHYRHTLRVYDLDGQNEAKVIIRIYADDESQPRATFTGTLRTPGGAYRTTSALLASHPAYLQLDPLQIASLTGATTMRIDVEPLEAGHRLWSFVSVTNNTTHHVTTFSAQ